METQIKPLESKKNPVFIGAEVSLIMLVITSILYFLKISSTLQNWGLALLLISGGFTFLMYKNQCPKCKRVFHLKKISDEVIKEWDEPKQYNEKTIYYYSDGFTQKDIKNGQTKTFIAKYERHKDGFQCGVCNETSYQTRDVFTNKDSWLRVTAPNKITTSTKAPEISFGFEPTYYKDKSGARKSIPSSVKEKLWLNYNGKKYQGLCFVCKKEIDTKNFEAGHVIPASKNGSDNISNLRPICKSCNRSMGDMNLNEFKKKYH